MRSFLLYLFSLLFLATPSGAQISESTDDWPGWKQAAVGVLGSTAVLLTVATIGAANADSNGGNNSGTSDGSSDGSSDGGSSKSDSGESNSGNERKGQGYVEELKDELLVFVNELGKLAVEGDESEESIALLLKEHLVLGNYYRELQIEHPEVIASVNENVPGTTLTERLNTVMIAHLFGDK